VVLTFGLKYGEFRAFSISTRNSALILPRSCTRFTALRSKRTSLGAVTTRLRVPHAPKPGEVSIQSGPLAGARYLPVGAPMALYPVAEVALVENAFTARRIYENQRTRRDQTAHDPAICSARRSAASPIADARPFWREVNAVFTGILRGDERHAI
jgi:hypothetical protein